MKFSLRNIFPTVIFLISFLCLQAQPSTSERPRLVIGIMIDGLQQKHLDMLWNYFDPNGFKKIISQSANCRNVSYNIVSAGNASDIASVMTGSIPYFNGVVGNTFYNRSENEIQSILEDESQTGIGTNQTLSAHKMLSSTVFDELMLTYPAKSKCYVVAQGAEEAIMLGGHTANSVVWMDDVNMKWVTTGYYKEGLSHWADEMNANGGFKAYATRTWEPLYNINTYISKPVRENKKAGFIYDPSSKKNRSSGSILRNTPSANSLVADLGMRIFTGEQLGNDKYPDVLLLQFSVRTPFEKTTALQSAEKEDMYLRLDKDIQNILHRIDSKIGLDKTIIFMFGNQTEIHSPTELGENKIPAGYFNADRSLALLSSYLMVIYGQQKWISGYYGKNIFLNKEKIEEKKLNLNSVQQTVADFLLNFEGIQSAFTSSQVLNMGGNANSDMTRVRNSTNKNCVGDVIITLMPGWLEVDNKNNPVGESNAIISYTPLYFTGLQIKPQTITTSYQTTDIAPTLSRLLNIPIPNACIGKPIEEITK